MSHEDTRTSLLYAACLGGKIDIIKRWINPGMDINQPLRHIQSFTDSMNKTPLFAACSGKYIGTVMILSFWTDLPGQTVQTQIRLFLEEQSDQGLHCLLFHLHLFDEIP